MKFLSIWVVALCVALSSAKAQKPIDLAPFKVAEGWYRINGGLRISPAHFLQQYAHLWGLKPQDEMRLHKTDTDGLGYEHLRYRQYFHQIPVEHTDLYLHYKNGLLVEANANVLPNIALSVSPAVQEGNALTKALAYLNAHEYAWQNPVMEANLKRETKNPNATHFPKGEVVITTRNGQPKLAYRFEVLSTKPHKHDHVYVDARTGEAIGKVSLRRTFSGESMQEYDLQVTTSTGEDEYPDEPTGFTNKCDRNATCNTLYNGAQNITVIKRLFDYKLDECDRDIHTVSYYNNGIDGSEITDNDGNWGNDDQEGTSAHWAAEKAHDYFRHTFGRRGSDGDGRNLSVVVGRDSLVTEYKYDRGSPLFYSRDIIIVGSEIGLDPPYINNNNPHATLEIIGHEYTHAIIGNTSKLNGNGEAYALAESFSDIFGTMIERYGQNGAFDWLAGTSIGNIYRSLQNPHLYGHAASIDDSLWVTPSHAARYVNSGVQNRWFYLLAMGGMQNGVTVQGIGIDKAAAIAYHNMTTKLSQSSNYAQARTGAIQAAIDLYGNCSIEVTQVRNAWAAVGVGIPDNATCLAVSLLGNTEVCYGASSVMLVANSNSTENITWTVPAGIEYVTSGERNEFLVMYNLPAENTGFDYGFAVSASMQGITRGFWINLYSCFLPFEQRKDTEENQAETSLRAYPNPAQGSFTLDLGKESTASLTILNAQGKTVGKKNLRSQKTNISTAYLPAGLYFLHITTGNERKVLKITVQ